MQIPTLAVLSLLLTPLTPMTATGQEKPTFNPLPEGARILSEKDGERRIQLKRGFIVNQVSKEKLEKMNKEPGYTEEQIRNATPADIIVPAGINPTPQAEPLSPDVTGPPVSVPGRAAERPDYLGLLIQTSEGSLP